MLQNLKQIAQVYEDLKAGKITETEARFKLIGAGQDEEKALAETRRKGNEVLKVAAFAIVNGNDPYGEAISFGEYFKVYPKDSLSVTGQAKTGEWIKVTFQKVSEPERKRN